MPLHKRTDSHGVYFIWGAKGHKYYFKPESARSESIARKKAMKQARAIERSKYQRKIRGKGEKIIDLRKTNSKNKNAEDWAQHFRERNF